MEMLKKMKNMDKNKNSMYASLKTNLNIKFNLNKNM